ncbi:MAG: response regulator [Nitrosarchaeum sp.]|nr:response regulator [Nitrosarchaeum sp.]
MEKNKTILIADDDLDVLESTQYMLLDEGYEVITAHNGAEAVDMYKRHNPDIVFLDIRMPVLNGYEAFFDIKKYDSNAKIIFITAFSIDSKKTEKTRDEGLLELLHKPIEFNQIIKIIQKYT